MANDDQIRNKKLQQDVNREAEKISVLSSRKSNKYEFLTSEEIVTPDQRRVIEQTTFAYYPLGKAFWKKKISWWTRRKTSWSCRRFRSRKTSKTKISWKSFTNETRNDKIKNEIDEIKKREDKIKQEDLKYEANRYHYDFQQFETTTSFGDNIYTGKISINEAKIDQTNSLEKRIEFNNKTRPKTIFLIV